MQQRRRKPISPDEALVRLEALCAASEQCSFDLLRKLRNWQIPPSDAEYIIDSLIERRFVNDARFATAYTRDKLRFSHWGRNKIKIGLMTKHISSAVITTALASIDGEEYTAICRHVLRTKVRNSELPCDFDGRTRLFRFGASRGFEPAIVSTIIRSGSPWTDGSNR